MNGAVVFVFDECMCLLWDVEVVVEQLLDCVCDGVDFDWHDQCLVLIGDLFVYLW